MKLFLSALLHLFLTYPLFATTVTASSSSSAPGDWDNSSTWSGGNVPKSGDVVLIPSGKAVVVKGEEYGSASPTLQILVNGTLNFEPSGKLNLSPTSFLQIFVGGKIVPKNGSSSQLITIAGVTKYNAANNGTVVGPAYADILSGVSLPGLPLSGFTPSVLAVTLNSFTANEVAGGIFLRWQATDENIETFVVERSVTEGITWMEAGTLTTKDGWSAYTFLDPTGGAGMIYYRIKVRSLDGHLAYSEVIRITRSAFPGAMLAPNPATTFVKISFSKTLPQKISIKLLSIVGQPIKTVVIAGGQSNYELSLQGIVKGTYLLQIETEGQLLSKQILMVQ